MRDNETTATTLAGKIRLNGALAGKEEPLQSWVPRSNHNWTDSNSIKSSWFQKQFIPTSFVISDVITNLIVEHNKCGGLKYDLYMRRLLTEYNRCVNTRMRKVITSEHKVL